jgi:hypothetical protein
MTRGANLSGRPTLRGSALALVSGDDTVAAHHALLRRDDGVLLFDIAVAHVQENPITRAPVSMGTFGIRIKHRVLTPATAGAQYGNRIGLPPVFAVDVEQFPDGWMSMVVLPEHLRGWQSVVEQDFANDVRDSVPNPRHFLEAFDAAMFVHDRH